jgi:uncharacterized membrane protein
MKSTASIKSHPMHPMLIPFPFAFLTGAWGFRVAAAFSENEELKTVSRYLVPTGLLAGLLAAVPGILDYLTPKFRQTACDQACAFQCWFADAVCVVVAR